MSGFPRHRTVKRDSGSGEAPPVESSGRDGTGRPARTGVGPRLPLDIQLITRPDDLLALEHQWNSLLQDSHNKVVQMTHEWITAWWRNFGGANQLHVLTVLDPEGRLAAIAPFMKGPSRYRGVRITKLSLMANGHSPSSDVIVRKDQNLADIVAALFLHIDRVRDVDLVELTKIDSGNAVYSAAVDYLAARGRLFRSRRDVESPYIPIDSSWEEFFARRSSKFRRTLRNKLNRARKLDDLSVEEVLIHGKDDSAIQDMLLVSSRSWKRKEGKDIATSPGAKGFYLDICGGLGPRGAVSLWKLQKRGVPIAFEFQLTYDNVVYPLRADFDQRYDQLSPGSLLEYNILKTLFDESRAREYDSCGHTYEYLMKWTDRTRAHVNVEIFTRRLLSYALYNLEYRLVPIARSVRSVSWFGAGRPGNAR